MKKTIKQTVTTMKLTSLNIAHSIYITGYTQIALKNNDQEGLRNDIERHKEWTKDYKLSKKTHSFTKIQLKQMKRMLDREFEFIEKRMNQLKA